MTAVWVTLAVLATMWTVGPAAYLLGHRFGERKARRDAETEWGAHVDELEVQLRLRDAELLSAQREIDEVKRDRSRAWDDAFKHGQVWQADRQAEGL